MTLKKPSAENNIDPGSVPPELSDLTQCEEMLTARAFPVMQVHVRKEHNAISYKVHIFPLPRNVQNVVNILPQCQQNLPVIAFAVKRRNNSDSFFNIC